MNIFDAMNKKDGFKIKVEDEPINLQIKSKQLCDKLNQIDVSDFKAKQLIFKELFQLEKDVDLRIGKGFQCDYGFNIHPQGLLVVNYNCIFLDTSSITLGDCVLIGPNTVLSCAHHPLDKDDRKKYMLSNPIVIEDNVWIGANCIILGGVHIGEGSVIGAGSVVTRDIPKGVVAIGCPCKVLRKITDKDKITPNMLDVID